MEKYLQNSDGYIRNQFQDNMKEIQAHGKPVV